MDGWNDNQLKCMVHGGNRNVFELFRSYDLMDLPAEERYKSKIANWNRRFLRAVTDDVKFEKEKPDYVKGRKHYTIFLEPCQDDHKIHE
jgi:hypothetical protein